MKSRTRILVAEDEGIVAMDIARQLTKLGYEPVGITGTAEEALELATSLRPQLVLMDIHLAGPMDGIQAATQLRERLAIPSIFLTAYATDEVVERAKCAEPLGYVIKPFDEYALRTSIEIALHKDQGDRALRESEARYREVAKSAALQSAALRAAANAIVITGRSGIIEWVNPAFSVLTGYGEDEVIGRNPRDLVRSGEQSEGFYAEMWDTIVAGRVWEGEVTNRRKDGTIYRELETITPVKNAAGEITNFVAIKRDLTHEKRLQEQFLQAQKMEVVGRLAGGIAHDFNNLLTVINGESDLALSGLRDDDPIREPLQAILDAGERAARLTAQLLAFSRKQIAAPAVVSVSALIKTLGPMIRRLVGEDIELALDLQSAADDHVRIDKGQFEQVILNLAVNARDAMPRGGVLRIGVTPAAAGVSVSITDTGVGIPPELRSRLFEPFFTTKPQGKGTGLGLATVYAIVAQTGGSLDVESTVGKGTTFTVLLPASSLPANTDAPPASASASRGHETIVLVEDESDVRELTARMLRSAGYAVIPMESSTAALAWFESTDRLVNLVISDVVMPGITGPELAKAVKSRRPDLEVLFASGYADDRLSAEVFTDPARFIAKPYQASMLTAKVRNLLDAQAVA